MRDRLDSRRRRALSKCGLGPGPSSESSGMMPPRHWRFGPFGVRWNFWLQLEIWLPLELWLPVEILAAVGNLAAVGILAAGGIWRACDAD